MAASQDQASTTMPAKKEICHLLSLPAELRNRIYNLCFAEPAKEVDLLEAQPPSRALLCTCRQIRDEARLMHRKAYREFWSNTRFFIHLSATEPRVTQCIHARHIISCLRADDVANITYMRRTGLAQGDLHKYVLIYSAGTWTEWDVVDDFKATKVATEIWFPLGQELPLIAAGFYPSDLTDRNWQCVDVTRLKDEDVRTAMRIINKRGLSREEVIHAVRE